VETLKLLVLAGIRRDVLALAAVALLLTAGLGAGLVSIEIADRTVRAYPEYLRQPEVGNLVVNPSLDTAEAEAMIRTVPGVLGVASDSLLTVAVNDNESHHLQARTSSDRRYTEQDRPVVREGRMIRSGAEAILRQVPVLLAGAFTVTMAASVVAGIASGTRARRRELAVVRALGGTPRQIRASVRWHATAVVAVGLVIGLPAGVIGGRFAFAAFARDLGAAPRPFGPLALLVGTVVVVLLTGLAASAVPARRAVAHGDAAVAMRADRAETRFRGRMSG
jgi:FtsX-like permease family